MFVDEQYSAECSVMQILSMEDVDSVLAITILLHLWQLSQLLQLYRLYHLYQVSSCYSTQLLLLYYNHEERNGC